MTQSLRSASIAAAVAAVSLLPVSALATNGYQLIGVGSYQKSLGGAVTANPGSAMTAITNPAGMIRIGRRSDFSMEGFMPTRKTDFSAYGGDTVESDASLYGVPAIGWTAPVGDREDLYFGGGMYGTSGLGVDYGETLMMPAQARTQLSVLLRLVKSVMRKKASRGPAGINQVITVRVWLSIQPASLILEHVKLFGHHRVPVAIDRNNQRQADGRGAEQEWHHRHRPEHQPPAELAPHQHRHDGGLHGQPLHDRRAHRHRNRGCEQQTVEHRPWEGEHAVAGERQDRPAGSEAEQREGREAPDPPLPMAATVLLENPG